MKLEDDTPLKDSFVKIFNDIQTKRLTEMLYDDDMRSNAAASVKKMEVDRLQMELEKVKDDLAKAKKQKSSFAAPAAPTHTTSSMGSSAELAKLFEHIFTNNDNNDFIDFPTTNQGHGAPTGYTLVSLPLWLGEVRQGGFHDLITAIAKGKDTVAIKMVQRALSDFSAKHHGKNMALSFIGNGPDTDVKTTLPAVFRSIVLLNGDEGDYAQWSTPVRLKIFLKNEELHFKDRLLYGGHFYATGSAEMNEKDGVMPKTTSSLTSLEILHIFWEDYRNIHKSATEIL